MVKVVIVVQVISVVRVVQRWNLSVPSLPAQCKIFASGVNFSIFTHFLCFFLLILLKLGEIDGVRFLA